MIGPTAYIHSNRLIQNITVIKNQIGNRKLMLVIKANGYGHGAINIAKLLIGHEDIIYCVFSIEEADLLRNNGIHNQILILSRMNLDWLHKAYENDYWVNACHFDDLKIIKEFYYKNNVCPKIHLEFDTGMTRLGFSQNEANKVFKFISENNFLLVEGIYSHFATADEGDISFADYQLKTFNFIISSSRNFNLSFKYIHCSNSGALLNLPNSYFNTVRVGMLAYGIAPSNEVSMYLEVKPVLSFCGPIVNVRRVQSLTPISYGSTYETKQSTNIGVIQMGFADGIPRPWYQNGYISYKGNHYKIAGRICMDQFMVDFGNIEPDIGDEVLVFGKKNNDKIPLEVIAEEIMTTTYVLLTSIHGRTKYVIL